MSWCRPVPIRTLIRLYVRRVRRLTTVALVGTLRICLTTSSVSPVPTVVCPVVVVLDVHGFLLSVTVRFRWLVVASLKQSTARSPKPHLNLYFSLLIPATLYTYFYITYDIILLVLVCEKNSLNLRLTRCVVLAIMLCVLVPVLPIH